MQLGHDFSAPSAGQQSRYFGWFVTFAINSKINHYILYLGNSIDFHYASCEEHDVDQNESGCDKSDTKTDTLPKLLEK